MGRRIFIFLLFVFPACSSGKGDGQREGKKDRPQAEISGLEGSALEETDASVEPGAARKAPRVLTEFPLHGRAGFPRVSIFREPDMMSPRLGYFRLGTRTRVGDAEYATEKCPKGWFQLREGGYVCQGRGMLVGKKPRYIKEVPPTPSREALDPYRHGFVRRDWTPLYKKMPTLEEMWHPPEPESDTEGSVDGGVAEEEIIPHSADEVDGGVDYYKYTKRNFRAVRALLSKGFWISIADRLKDESTGLIYYQTVAREYVPADNIHPVTPPECAGYRVLGDSPLPAVIVTANRASFYERKRGRMRSKGWVQKMASFRVLETQKVRGENYYRIDEDRWLRQKQVVDFQLRPPPEGVGFDEKWIRVDLTRQTLEAYHGPAPVFVTLVSTGLPDSEETVTPNGTFRVRFKHYTDNMTGTVGDDEAYSVDDVPWVQYIHQNIAFHAAFWHNGFGRPKSHGCINLAPADARWLFDWTEPALPEGWHGVAETAERPGTRVVIEGITPKS